MKLYWKVGDAPTGRFRSFEKRSWPFAYYDKAMTLCAAYIGCDASYIPRNAKEGNHPPLIVRVADYSVADQRFVWRKLNSVFATLELAKSAAATAIDNNPKIKPVRRKGI